MQVPQISSTCRTARGVQPPYSGVSGCPRPDPWRWLTPRYEGCFMSSSATTTANNFPQTNLLTLLQSFLLLFHWKIPLYREFSWGSWIHDSRRKRKWVTSIEDITTHRLCSLSYSTVLFRPLSFFHILTSTIGTRVTEFHVTPVATFVRHRARQPIGGQLCCNQWMMRREGEKKTGYRYALHLCIDANRPVSGNAKRPVSGNGDQWSNMTLSCVKPKKSRIYNISHFQL